ncbi:hypothetical protein D3C71_1408570 [compost metagenome]
MNQCSVHPRRGRCRRLDDVDGLAAGERAGAVSDAAYRALEPHFLGKPHGRRQPRLVAKETRELDIGLLHRQGHHARRRA